MRRKEREVTARGEIEEILRACKVCHLAVNGEDGVPYIVPLNFGYSWQGTWPVLYMHCAPEGQKLELLRRDNRVAFEMDCGYAPEGQADLACTYTNRYASLIGAGDCEIVTAEDEKEAGLRHLMQHVIGARDWKFDRTALAHTVLLRVHVRKLTAKKN